MRGGSGPIGVVLAGGLGRRLGGDKAGVLLDRRPLAQWVVDALGSVLADVVVACRLDTRLPVLRGVREAWVEPNGPRGPVVGVVSALREARGRPIVTCSLSLPLMSAGAVRALVEAGGRGPLCVVPQVGDRLEPLLARWEPGALSVLAGLPADLPLGAAARASGHAVVCFPGSDQSFTRVWAPEDLLQAGAVLDARRRAGAAAGSG